jgi:Tfp pilus assembly protein PilF
MLRSSLNERRWIAAALAAAIGTCVSAAFAVPHIPSDDAQIVERLPLVTRTLQHVAAVTATNDSVDAALAAARRYVEVGQTYSDPRAYGYAQAALGKWWSADPAPSEVLVMRARILQFRHEFDAGLRQLEPALRSDQFNPDAWLLFASISQVQGNVRAARLACLKLVPIADPLVGTTCVAATAALSGNAANAASLLAKALGEASAATPAERTWAWTILGEVRAAGEDYPGAAAAFDEALRISADDVYTRAAYADLLLDAGNAAKARSILGDDPRRADALLLRAAIAAQRNHDTDADSLREDLAQRFAEARARGDETHLREQARLALEIDHDAIKALDLAQRNFKEQREPADVRILLEAANAAGDARAARPALDWLKSTGMHAPRLLRLARITNAEGGT